MSLFKLQNKTIQPIKESSFDLEKDLQKIVEENIEKIFGLKFISSEFIIHGLRIDTLAYDPETQSFVIIEYKRDRSQSVVDQGFAYLSLLLNNPDSFILEYAKKTNIPIQDIKLDQSQSRIMFLASSFNMHQQTAINFKDIPIELWEVKKYEEGILEFDQLKSPIADMKNTGSRAGGSITAALFLQQFVKNTPWAHLDIAGPVWAEKPTAIDNEGGTGFAVRTLVNWILSN